MPPRRQAGPEPGAAKSSPCGVWRGPTDPRRGCGAAGRAASGALDRSR
jgi:hypothetical protein